MVVPDRLEPGALIVRTTAATVCATDVHLADGSIDPAASGIELPVILGHEMVGEVVRLGDGAATDSIGAPLRIGDRIIWTHGFRGRCSARVVDHEPTLCRNRRG